MEGHSGRMKISRSRIVIDRVHSTRRRGIVSRWLICERSERKGIDIQQRGRQSPLLGGASRRQFLVLGFFALRIWLSIEEDPLEGVAKGTKGAQASHVVCELLRVYAPRT